MRTKSYYSLKKIAYDEYCNTSAGLSFVRQYDRYFLKNKNKHGQSWFYMNYREKCCHMIGFLDAIIWLGRNNALDVAPKFAHLPPYTECELEEEFMYQYFDEYTRRLVLSVIASFETGEDLDYNDGDL